MRTYGDTKNCAGCRYWSERIAQSIGCGPVEAMCFAPNGPRAGKYTTARVTCEAWARGDLGAIDDPYEPDIRRAYEMFDKQIAAGVDPHALIADIGEALAAEEPDL